MVSDTDDRSKATESSSDDIGSRRRRRHHHKRPYYYRLLPYRRELKNFALFCAVVALSYLLWTAIAR
jgi:hypothetical protein